MTDYIKIFENNRRWAAAKKVSDAQFFERLAKGQDPDFLYIGCSDSRVSAEEMMGASPGDIFVHRNIANLVNHDDLSAMSVINFAVNQLEVKHIVVCGHYQCGGVKAAMDSIDLGELAPWLKNIRQVLKIHSDQLSMIKNDAARYNRLVELNVRQQFINVLSTPVVQKTYLEKGYPVVHGWVFDVGSGELIDLNFDFLEELRLVLDSQGSE